jgi:methyl-accepting chemotaxis protein
MNWFRNLSTLSKLMAGFSLVCLLGAGVGYLGIVYVGDVNNMLEHLFDKNTMSMLDLARGNTQALYHNRGLYQYIVENDKTSRETRQREMEKFEATMKDRVNEYRKTTLSPEEEALLKKFDAAWANYKEVAAKTIQLANEGKEQPAVAMMKNETLAAFRDARDLYTEIINLNEDLAKKAYEESATVYGHSRTVLISMVCISAILGILCGMMIARMVAQPLAQAVSVLKTVADGDLTRTLDIHTSDEVGQMAKALNRALESMRSTLEEVRGSADSVASSAQELASSSEELSSGAQEQASNLEETTASMEEITSSVRQNADNAKQANQLVTASRESAEKGGQVVSAAVTAMGEINTASKKIADIITAIDEIAFQTNLLALNAAVEAARAGEQGRGFAVVASEVRSLAQRSATAAKEIKSLIQDTVRKVDAGSEMVNESGKVLLEIVSSVKRVTDIVGEIAAASQEQATGVDQMSKAMTQMDQVTQANAAQTEELSSTAQALTVNAEEMLGMVARFKLEHQGDRRATAARPQAPAQPQGSASRAPSSLKRLSKAVGRSTPVHTTAADYAEHSQGGTSTKDGFVEF